MREDRHQDTKTLRLTKNIFVKLGAFETSWLSRNSSRGQGLCHLLPLMNRR